MRTVKRILLAFASLWTIYLVPVNLALNLPLTQRQLNALQPDSFAISWERGWSLYPLRVELRGFTTDGQTPTRQWQADAASVGASVSLPSLLRGELRVQNLDLADLVVRLRPRPTSGQDFTDLKEFFPVIRGRDPESPAEPAPPESEAALLLVVENIHLSGEHEFWVSHIRGTLPGDLRGTLSLDANRGLIGFTGGDLDLALTSLRIADDPDVAGDASIRGKVEVPPFAADEVEGLAALDLLTLEADVDVPVHSLHFLNLYLRDIDGIELNGAGRMRGHLDYDRGDLRSDTNLIIEAHDLALDLARFAYVGEGVIELKGDPEGEDLGSMTIRFADVEAFLREGPQSKPQPIYTGRDLEVTLHLLTRLGPEAAADDALRLTMDIPSMQVPDLRVYQRLLPEKWGIAVLGGQGALSGHAEISHKSLELDFQLTSDDADLRYRNHRFTTDLTLGLRARTDDSEGATLDLTGTSLRLDEARLHNTGEGVAQPWQASFRVNQGRFTVPVPEDKGEEGVVRYLVETLSASGFGSLLNQADGRAQATLDVSRLGWITRLLGNPFNLAITGSGAVDADLRLEDGLPDKGTTLKVRPQGLELQMLEHLVSGEGTATLLMERGGMHPDLHFQANIAGAGLKRRDEHKAVIEDVRLDVDARVSHLGTKHSDAKLDLRIHSARVTDMGVFNAYLSPHAPVELLSGTASLVGELHLKQDAAEGFFNLEAQGLRARLDQEEVSGHLMLDLLIRDGSPKDLRFDIAGSSLVLDRVQVVGPTQSSREPDWKAHFQLEKADVVWHKPMHMQMTAGVTIKDTRPFVAVLDNLRGEHGWIDEMLTVEDPGGHVELTMDGKRVLVSDAMLGSDKLNVGVKGLADAGGREGIVYVRWHDITGALRVKGDERHFDLVNARPEFDAYVPGHTALALSSDARRAPDPAVPQTEGPADPTQPAGDHHRPAARVREAPTESDDPFVWGD